jgi:hypothetical protein
LLQLLSLSWTELPYVILQNGARVRTDLKTKIPCLSQHEKSLRIHHFSEQSKSLPKFQTYIIFDPESAHERPFFGLMCGIRGAF